MIREITRKQIDLKTALGERVFLVEAVPQGSYERRHIPTAIRMNAKQVRRNAQTYFPNLGAEIVVYGHDENSTEPRLVARKLEALGYQNLFYYRAGKRDWFKAGEFEEAVHAPPGAEVVVKTPRGVVLGKVLFGALVAGAGFAAGLMITSKVNARSYSKSQAGKRRSE